MSGWWLAASAISATWLTNATRREVGELEVPHQRAVLLAPLAHILSPVRIVSLVPSATEMLFALGLGDEVTAVTHECDHPAAARVLPKVTRDVIGPGLAPAEIDRAVRDLTQQGKAIYELDEGALRALQPDLIVTQALCAVCAVSYDDVKAVAGRIESEPQVISLDPHTLGEVLGDARTLAEAAGARDAGVDLVQDAASRIDRVRLAVRPAEPVRVAALEWLDPIYVAGHWTPQLIEYAGGLDVLGLAGEHSEVRSWDEVRAAKPEVIVVMPCGYDAERALEESYDFADELGSVGAQRVVAVDAAAYFSRPGPRLIDGLELLAGVLHPDRVPEAPGRALPVAL
jgi:iron complex transport system substrate-binding protein